jgi:hypothetical protein
MHGAGNDGARGPYHTSRHLWLKTVYFVRVRLIDAPTDAPGIFVLNEKRLSFGPHGNRTMVAPY